MKSHYKKGWIRLYRQIEENPLYFLEPFTKLQAWIDMILNANHKNSTIQIRGNIVELSRGQLGWSELTMAKRWQWSKNRVRRFLQWLMAEQQIKQQKDHCIITIVTILNYDKFQSVAGDTAENGKKSNTANDIIENETADDTADDTAENGKKNVMITRVIKNDTAETSIDIKEKGEKRTFSDSREKRYCRNVKNDTAEIIEKVFTGAINSPKPTNNDTAEMLKTILQTILQTDYRRYTDKNDKNNKNDKNIDILCASDDALPATPKQQEYRDWENWIVLDWNTFCEKYPILTKIAALSQTRKKKLKLRFGQKTFRDFQTILSMIEKQPFLLSGNTNNPKHSNWRVSLDWLIANDTNHLKVLEGKYVDAKTEEQSDAKKFMEEYGQRK